MAWPLDLFFAVMEKNKRSCREVAREKKELLNFRHRRTETGIKNQGRTYPFSGLYHDLVLPCKGQIN